MFHFAFHFGFGKYFNFNITFGRPPVSKDTSSNPDSVNAIWPQIAQNQDMKPRRTIRATNAAIEHCILFGLPTEVRFMIYKELLVSECRIRNAGRYIGYAETPMLSGRKRISDVDATITRTCRAVYDETMPILYGHNVFLFEKAEDIKDFKRKGLKRNRELCKSTNSEYKASA